MSALRQALCGLVLVLGCAPAPDPADTIVLLGGEVFAAGDRCADLLDELARSTGTLGTARFVVVGEPGDRPADLLHRLTDVPRVRAVVAVLGDLALMHEIDPDRPIPPLKQLTSRRVDEAALVAAVDGLARHCAGRGATLVLATPPLGIQGRVEVPELLRVAASLRELAVQRALPLLDLTTAFREHESEALFDDDIDSLDAYGHDLFARLVFDGLRQESVLASTSEVERDARLGWQLLLAWAAGGDDASWKPRVPRLLQQPAPDVRGAVLRASLANLQLGMLAPTRQRWRQIDTESAGELLPVLAVGRALCGDAVGELPASDALTRDLLAMLATYHGASEVPLLEHAEAEVVARPARLGSWIALETAARITRERKGVARDARAHLHAFLAPPISLARSEQLLADWPSPLTALPAVLLLERAYASFLPTGELLQHARRQARAGRTLSAKRLLERALRKLHVPANWQAELDTLAAATR